MDNPVVIEAREWIGTPYRHQHSAKGAGCDCLGLVRGVWRNVVGAEPEKPPNYSASWGEVGDTEPMLEAAARHMIPVEVAEPGDVLIFRMKRNYVAKHCGILSVENKIIHAYEGEGRVAESIMGDYWKRRIVGRFRFP